jgi:glycosyltransferase involved in cell wall biosynthesis
MQNGKKALSIVIPAFNEEKFLPHCLQSLKNQDYDGDFEIIVADNASTDATAAIAAISGARVVSCHKKGVAYARQAGAAAAAGDIIIQADADTVYPRNWLSRIARHFASHPESTALAGVYIYQNEEQPYWAKLEYFFKYLINQTGRLLLGRPVLISGANFAFRREAFLRTGGYRPEALYPDQWGISNSLSKVGKIAFDRTLMVSTSTRRVQRAFHLIICDIGLNVSRVFAHLVRHEVNLLKPITSVRRQLKAPARWTTWIIPIIMVGLLAGFTIDVLAREGYNPIDISELIKIPTQGQQP